MGPLFLANWQLIHRRFCLMLWLLASILVVAILIHFANVAQACASQVTPHTPTCPATTNLPPRDAGR